MEDLVLCNRQHGCTRILGNWCLQSACYLKERFAPMDWWTRHSILDDNDVVNQMYHGIAEQLSIVRALRASKVRNRGHKNIMCSDLGCGEWCWRIAKCNTKGIETPSECRNGITRSNSWSTPINTASRFSCSRMASRESRYPRMLQAVSLMKCWYMEDMDG